MPSDDLGIPPGQRPSPRLLWLLLACAALTMLAALLLVSTVSR